MPIMQNKNSSKARRGVTLIEVMIVLAISGVLVVIAIATLGSRNSVLLEQSARQVQNSVKTAYNEAVSGLGPAGVANTNPASDPVNFSGVGSGEELFGQAVEVVANCDGPSLPCLRVYKLKNTPTGITAYERYRIDVPANFRFVSTALNGLNPAGYSPSPSMNPLLVFTSSGRSFIFNRNPGTGSTVGELSVTDGAADPSNYNSPYTAGTVTFRFEESANKFFSLIVNMASAGDVGLQLP